ncbi:MAG: transketolase [Flavobacteriales bacterium TMED113]|nr:MAG: transketolase [Flavobacteriales bacterium TMED113]
MKTPELEKISCQVRRDIVRMVHAVQSGHPGGSLGCVEFLVALFFEKMTHKNEFNMDGENEDLFFLSNGHISPVLYSVLARSGYFNINELKTFRNIDSRLQGHPATKEKLPGIRIASGSLGQGLSVAIGACEAKKLNKDTKLVYCLCGDGELQEGQIWEALMYANAKKIDNLIMTVDLNKQQICGSTEEILSLGDLNKKITSFGWEIVEIEDGNEMYSVLNGINSAIELTKQKKPVCILLNTQMGFGVDFMMGSHKWHGIAPNDEQLEIALDQLEETLGDY